VRSTPPTAASHARFDLHGTQLGTKAYSNNLGLKVSDADDRGMTRKEVGHIRHTCETLEEAIPVAHSLVKLKYVARWFSLCGY